MSAQSDYFELIKQISGQKNVITVPRLFVKITGELNQAVLLSQCIYWSDRTNRTDGFFYKTADEFSDELGISPRQVRYAAERLEEAGFITMEIHRANGSPTTHYRVNLDTVTTSILQICKIDFTPVSNPSDTSVNFLTEITTEINSTTTTTENPEKNIYAIYEKNIAPLTPMVADELDDCVKTYTLEWVIEAIKEAAKSEVHNIKYITAILRRWKSQGFKSQKPQSRSTGNKPPSSQAEANRRALAEAAERDKKRVENIILEEDEDGNVHL